jgi:PAT family beta-lactamase induction signal transducer AmpG
MTGLLTSFPIALLKLLDFSNETVGLVTGVGLVAAFRFLYAPWLDGATSKRRLSLCTLALGSMSLCIVAFAIWNQPSPNVFLMTFVGALLFLTVVAAAHETAADGYYIRALDSKLQAQFIGIKTAAIRIGGLSVIMGLMVLATRIAAHYGATGVDSPDKTGFHIGFSTAYFIAAFAVAGILLWNKFKIPVVAHDQPVKHDRFAILEVLKEYFTQDRVFLMILLIIFYRFGEGFLAMKQPFYLDPLDAGGLAVTATSLPYYAILTDMPWMIIGGILGGYIIKWYGIKRVLIPLALAMSLPNIFYVALAWAQPTTTFPLLGEQLNLWLVFASCIESFGYGLSFSGMFYYMHIMATLSGRNKTSVLAISFAIMNVGWILPGMLSGVVQAQVGYVNLFLISSTVGLVVLFIIPHLPMPNFDKTVVPATDP